MSVEKETRYLKMRSSLDANTINRLFSAYRNYHWDRWEGFQEDLPPLEGKEDFREFLNWLFRPEDMVRIISKSKAHHPEYGMPLPESAEASIVDDEDKGEGKYLLDKPYYYDKPRDTYVVIGKGEGKVSINPKNAVTPTIL